MPKCDVTRILDEARARVPENAHPRPAIVCFNGSMARILSLAIVLFAAVAAADPAPLTKAPSVMPILVLDVPPPPVPSLRIEALRVAGERVDSDWHYPEPGPVFGYDRGFWFVGYDQYTPRTGRSAALHAGSVSATILGGMLLDAIPAAGAAALAAGVTLDAAAADVDRDAEARKP